MKKLFFTIILSSFSIMIFAQNKDESEVKAVLKSYSSKIEQLDTAGISSLFVKNSSIYEGGNSEGTIDHYLQHHLAPELKEFKSFTFSDYKVDVTLSGQYAFSIETYIYTIVLAKDSKELKSKGVATSVLKKINGKWKFVSVHSSFRKTK